MNRPLLETNCQILLPWASVTTRPDDLSVVEAPRLVLSEANIQHQIAPPDYNRRDGSNRANWLSVARDEQYFGSI